VTILSTLTPSGKEKRGGKTGDLTFFTITKKKKERGGGRGESPLSLPEGEKRPDAVHYPFGQKINKREKKNAE